MVAELGRADRVQGKIFIDDAVAEGGELCVFAGAWADAGAR
jgi:hypothetical protein